MSAMEAVPVADNQQPFESQFQELLQSMQRDFNCLGDANRATRTGALDRLKKKLLPLDGKVQHLPIQSHFEAISASNIEFLNRNIQCVSPCLSGFV